VLYTFFPGKVGRSEQAAELSEGSRYTDEILEENPGPSLDPVVEGEGPEGRGSNFEGEGEPV
jgi:hypothetical protein